MVSCGAPSGSSAKLEAGSVLELLLAQDNFDGEDFGRPELDEGEESGSEDALPIEEKEDQENENREENQENQQQPILGCTNPQATNFDPNATQDDGSCIIPPPPESSQGTGAQVHVGVAKSDLNPNGGYKYEIESNSDYKRFLSDYRKKYRGSGTMLKPKGYHDNSICPVIFRSRKKGSSLNDDCLDNVFDPYSVEELIAKMERDGVNASNLPVVENLCCHITVTNYHNTYEMVECKMKNSRHGYNIAIGAFGECQYNVDLMGGQNSGDGDTGISHAGTDGFSYGIGDSNSSNGYARRRINGLYAPDRTRDSDLDGSKGHGNPGRQGKIKTINISWVGTVTDERSGLSRPDLETTKKVKNCTMTPAQAYAYLELIRYFVRAFPNIKVIGHNQVTLGKYKAGKKRGGKTCPGWWVPELNDIMGLNKKHTYEECLGDLSQSDRERLNSWKVGSSDDTLSNHKSYKGSRYKNTSKYIFELAKAGKTSSLRAGLPVPGSTSNTNPTGSAGGGGSNTPTSGNSNTNTTGSAGGSGDWRTMECPEFVAWYNDTFKKMNTNQRTGFLMGLSSEDSDLLSEQARKCQT